MTIPSENPSSSAMPLSEKDEGFGGRALLLTLFRNICFAFVLGNLAMFGKGMLLHAYSADFPWLLNSGLHILEHGGLPQSDIFSWTFPDKQWIMYQWLFEVILALIHNLLGTETLIRLFVVLTVGLYVIVPLVIWLPRKIPLLFILLISSSALYSAGINISLRPMIVTSLFLAAQFILIQRHRENKLSFNALATLIAVIYALWGNLHAGVIVGLMAIFLMAAGDWLEQRNLYRFSPPVEGLQGKPISLKPYVIVAISAIVASLINPYGIGIYTHLHDWSSQKYLNDIIVELQSPNFHILNFKYFVGFLGLFILLMARANRRFSAQEILLILFFTLETLFVMRFIVWACIFYALILPKALYYWWVEFKESCPAAEEVAQSFDIYRPLFITVISATAVIFLLFPDVLPNRYFHVRLGECENLITGLRAYQSLKLPSDRLYTDPVIGSCSLIVNPKEKLFADTRFDFYGEEFTRPGREASSLTGNWEKFFSKWKINTVIITRDWPLLQLLELKPEYRILYKDKTLAIFRKSDKTRGFSKESQY